MATDLVVGVGWVGMVVLALSVVGTVHRRERLLFVPAVLVVMLAMTFLSGIAAGLVAFVGLAAVFASTLPMLRE